MKIYLNLLYFISVIIILYLALPLAIHPVQAVSPPTTGYIWGRAIMPDDATGIAGCEVELLGRGDYVMAKSTSDASGNFVFTNLPPNDETWGYRLAVRRGSWGESVTQQFSVFADSATQVTVRVYPYLSSFSLSSTGQTLAADGRSRVTLTITLLDKDGKPVPDGVHMRLSQSSFYPNPGQFFAGAANGTEVTLATRDGKITVQYGDVPADTLSRWACITADGVETAGSRSLNLTLDLVNPNAIEGTVFDATGRPVPYAKVYLSRWDGVSRYAGYNSSETDDPKVRADGGGTCDASGHYRFAVLPAGDYRVNASEASFTSSVRTTVVHGTYIKNITLPMGRGSIAGRVKDNQGYAVPGATVSLLRAYDKDLVRVATNASGADGSFGFNDVLYGKYDVQVVYAGQTADLTLELMESRQAVTIALLHDVEANGSERVHTAPPASTAPAPPTKATVTPRPPTPTPPPVTPSYILSTYGVSVLVMGLIGIGILFVSLRMGPK